MRDSCSRSRTSPALKASPRELYLGLDFGTSGARATVIRNDGAIVEEVKQDYGGSASSDWATSWERSLWQLLEGLSEETRSGVAAVAFDGTSATAVLVDTHTGHVLAPPKLYNEAQNAAAVAAAKDTCPPAHTATAPTSALCKLLAWQQDGTLSAAAAGGASPVLLHQADWLASLLHGRRDVTDWNNALKLGYEPGAEMYPDWLTQQELGRWLPPTVLAPGAPVAAITRAAAAACGLPDGCLVCAGTTDSIAAFIAAGVTEAGSAVSSLGSTLAIKLLSHARVDDAATGVYSHRYTPLLAGVAGSEGGAGVATGSSASWLVGGASNVGGAVLRQFFTDAQLIELSARVDPAVPSNLDYYPLPRPGERFPVADPHMQPRLQPRPADDALFLQGILEGIAAVEADSYRLLARMGATPLKEVQTSGGGAANDKWTAIRAAALGVPVRAARHGEASYGVALLARAGHVARTSGSM